MSDVRIIEVGPRDGLQNEKAEISIDAKVRWIEGLVAAGLNEIEAGSFVSPKWVPQMAGTAELWPRLPSGAEYLALVPNARGLADALAAGVKRIAVFTAASDAFNLKNVNRDVETHLRELTPIISQFRAAGGEWVRGYVSTITHDPYVGAVDAKRVAQVSESLFSCGCDEVSLGETLGKAAPKEIGVVIGAVSELPTERIAWHFHDTFGHGRANVELALDAGYRAFDSSASGLGGCPYAPGAGGNIATELLVETLEARGFATGIDLAKLRAASTEVRKLIAGLGAGASSK